MKRALIAICMLSLIGGAATWAVAGDAKLLKNLFVGVDEDPLGLAADFHDGAKSILTGIGANISMKTGLPVKVQELIHW